MSYMTAITGRTWHCYLGTKDWVHVLNTQTVQTGVMWTVWGAWKCLCMCMYCACDCAKSLYSLHYYLSLAKKNNFFRMPLSIYHSLSHLATRPVEYTFDRYIDTQIKSFLTTTLDFKNQNHNMVAPGKFAQQLANWTISMVNTLSSRALIQHLPHSHFSKRKEKTHCFEGKVSGIVHMHILGTCNN